MQMNEPKLTSEKHHQEGVKFIYPTANAMKMDSHGIRDLYTKGVLFI